MNKSGTGPIEHATFLRIENRNNQLVLIRKFTEVQRLSKMKKI